MRRTTCLRGSTPDRRSLVVQHPTCHFPREPLQLEQLAAAAAAGGNVPHVRLLEIIVSAGRLTHRLGGHARKVAMGIGIGTTLRTNRWTLRQRMNHSQWYGQPQIQRPRFSRAGAACRALNLASYCTGLTTEKFTSYVLGVADGNPYQASDSPPSGRCQTSRQLRGAPSVFVQALSAR